MKFSILILTTLLSSTSAFAAYVNSSKLTCENQDYKMVLKTKGSYFGEDRITLSEAGLFGGTILDEETYMIWDPNGDTVLEQVVRSEGSKDYSLTKSDTAEIIVANFVSNGEITGRKVYLRDLSLNQIYTFDFETECREGIRF